MSKNDFRYPQSKSSFRLKGIINGKDSARKNMGFKEGKTKTNKDYRTLRFFVRTSPLSNIPVELFGTAGEKAYLFNKDTRTTEAVPWAQRNILKMDGFQLIKPDFDLAGEIEEEFANGDSVVIVGRVQYQEVQRRGSDQVTIQPAYTISRIYHCDDPLTAEMMEDPAYEEEAAFSQELIVNEAFELDGKLILSAYVINYGDRFIPYNFEVSQENERFVSNIRRLKPGTFLKAEGKIVSRALVVEQQSVSDEWGAKQYPVAAGVEKAMVITYVDPETIVPGLYTETQITEAIAEANARRQEKNAAFNPQKRAEPAPLKEFDADSLPFKV